MGGKTPIGIASIAFSILCVILASAPLLILNDIHDNGPLPKRICIQIGALVVLVLWLMQAASNGIVRIRCSRSLLPIGILLIWSLSSVWWARDRYSAITTWAHWSACFVFFFLSIQLISGQKRTQIALASILVGSGVIATLGILQHLAGVGWVVQVVPPAATFINKNLAAQFIILSIPPSVILFVIARKHAQIYLLAAMFAFQMVFLYYTRTRAAWVGVASELVLLTGFVLYERLYKGTDWRTTKHHRVAMALVPLIILVMSFRTPKGWAWTADEAFKRVSASWRVFEKASPAEKDEVDVGTIKQRLRIWQNSIHMIADRPLLGLGLYNFAVEYPRIASRIKRDRGVEIDTRPRHAHNDLIQISTELGLLSLIPILWMGLLLVACTRRIVRNAPEPVTRLTAALCLIGIIGSAVNAQFSFPFYRSIPPLMVAVYAGMIVGLRWPDQQTGQVHSDSVLVLSGRRTPAVLLALVSILLLVWAYLQLRWVRADKHFLQHTMAFHRHDWESAIFHGEKTRRLNPSRPDVLTTLGWSHTHAGNPSYARKYLDRFRDMYPHAPNNLYHLAVCLEKLGQLEESRLTLREASNLVPLDPTIHNALARIYSKLGQRDEALSMFEYAVKLSPDSAKLHYDAGVEALNQRLYSKSAEHLRSSLALDDSSADAHKALGWVLITGMQDLESGYAW